MPPMLGATSNEPMSWHYEVSPGPVGTRFAEIRRFETIDSTNLYLVGEALAGAPEGLVAMADHQSSGRGRLGRRWEAPAGANLLTSVLLRPDLEARKLHLLTILVALAAADACVKLAALDPQLKWPNDLLVGSRKLAGILAESVFAHDSARGTDEEHPRAVVIGLGLNVLWPAPARRADELADSSMFESTEELSEIENMATSLWRESSARGDARKLEPRAVLDAVLEGIEDRLRDVARIGGDERQMTEYRSRCATLGREVSVSLGEEIHVGTAIDLTDEGHLVLRDAEEVRTITAGDVVHLDQSYE